MPSLTVVRQANASYSQPPNAVAVFLGGTSGSIGQGTAQAFARHAKGNAHIIILGRNASDALLDDVDLVLLDIKSGDPATYTRTTGRDLQPTLDFSRRLAERGNTMWVRFVLVPGLTDDEANVAAVAEHVATLGPAVERVEVLPFHQMGRDKWESLGLPYELSDTEPPSAELIARVMGQFEALGLPTFRG